MELLHRYIMNHDSIANKDLSCSQNDPSVPKDCNVSNWSNESCCKGASDGKDHEGMGYWEIPNSAGWSWDLFIEVFRVVVELMEGSLLSYQKS